MMQLTGLLECMVLRYAGNSGSATTRNMSLEGRLADSTYVEGHAMVLSHARDSLGHATVQTICNFIARQYFCAGSPSLDSPDVAYWSDLPGVLSTLHYAHSHKVSWYPGSKPAIDLPGTDDDQLLEIVSKHAGLFKHDLGLRGFKLEIVNDCNGLAGWDLSPL